MPNPDIAWLRRLLAAATSGPWSMWAGRGWPREWHDIRSDMPADEDVVWPIAPEGRGTANEPSGVFLGEHDQRAVCALLNAAPYLLTAAERVERLEADVAELTADLRVCNAQDHESCMRVKELHGEIERLEAERATNQQRLDEIRAALWPTEAEQRRMAAEPLPLGVAELRGKIERLEAALRPFVRGYTQLQIITEEHFEAACEALGKSDD